MSRQDIAAVFDLQLPFQKAFHKVAPRTEYYYRERQSQPFPSVERRFETGKICEAATATNPPPTEPSHDLFGEIRGNSL